MTEQVKPLLEAGLGLPPLPPTVPPVGHIRPEAGITSGLPSDAKQRDIIWNQSCGHNACVAVCGEWVGGLAAAGVG